MVDTTTTRYGWTIPQVGGSNDNWGPKIKTTIEAIDEKLFSVESAVAPGTEPARQHTTGYLHLLGLAVPSAATFNLQPSTAYLIPVCQMIEVSAVSFKLGAHGAGASARVSLYDGDSKGKPGTLVETLTGVLDLAASATNLVASFAAKRTLKPSQWLCFHTNGSVSGAVAQACGVVDPLEASRLFGVDPAAGLSNLTAPSTFMGLSKALAYGTIAADPFPTAGLAGAVAVPMLWGVAS